MAQARILIVDDEEAIRTALSEILEEDGHEPLCAATVEQGWRWPVRASMWQLWTSK